MFKFLLSLRPERPQPAARPHAMLEGGLLRLAKLHCTAAQVHPWALDAADALVPCLQICTDIATQRGMGGLSWRTLTSRALRYLDLVLRSPHLHHMERVVTLRPPVRPHLALRHMAPAPHVGDCSSLLHGALEQAWGDVFLGRQSAPRNQLYRFRKEFGGLTPRQAVLAAWHLLDSGRGMSSAVQTRGFSTGSCGLSRWECRQAPSSSLHALPICSLSLCLPSSVCCYSFE